MPALRPYLLLAVLWGLYFHPLVLHPTQTLYAPYSDFLAEHLPARVFLVREWRTTGELPLWNPYHFCGSPFVHDIQAGVFYPPYAATYLFPESAAGAVMSWAIALHVLAAGVFAHVYARSHGLGDAGSLVAALGFMFSAKWMTHLLLAGHTVTVGLAWLPLVLLGLERGTRAGGAGPSLGAGAALALMVLGTHPQWTFYAGVFAAAWTLPVGQPRTAYRRWLLAGVGAVAVAVALAAVQLLPTLEAAGQSSRAVGLTSTEALKVGAFALFGLVGPAPVYDPPGIWEARGLLGLTLLAAAAAAPRLAPERGKYQFWVLLGLVVFSLGGAALVDWLPGFDLFRIPARMLLVATFPLAFLAGVSTDALARSGWAAESVTLLRRRTLLVLAVAAAPSLAYVAVELATPPAKPLWGPFASYWAVTALVLPFALGLVPGPAPVRTLGWVAAVAAELVAGTSTFPAVRPQADVYPPSGTLGVVLDRLEPGTGRAMDWDMGTGPGDRLAVFGVGSPQALLSPFPTPRGYNPLDVRHYREFIGFVVGAPGPVLGLSPVAQPILPNFVVGHPRLLDHLNARYLAAAQGVEVAPGWKAVAIDPAPPVVPAIPPNPPPHLPPHVIYERPSALPRAWVVPEAKSMPPGDELAVLVATDFRRTVLLATDRPLPPASSVISTVRVAEYRPNRVRLELPGTGRGFLVLADVWYPGWVCRLDGEEVPVERANHAFRAVELPAGATEAVFTFEPRSYRLGWQVSVVSLVAVALAGGLVLLRGPVATDGPAAYPNPTPSPAGPA